MQVGVYGEVRAVVKRKDGEVRLDTGFFPNVITDLGLDFIGSDSGDMFFNCAVGSGNSTPAVTNTTLDNFIAVGAQFTEAFKEDYDPERDKDYYKVSRTVGYRFTGLVNQNISEVALVSTNQKESHKTYTRTLVKNDSGTPTTITVLEGEILELQYRLWQVFSVADKDQEVTALIDGVETPFTVKIRPAAFGGASVVGNWSNAKSVGKPVTYKGNNSKPQWYEEGELGGVNSEPSGNKIFHQGRILWGQYIARSYKRTMLVKVSITELNTTVRSLVIVSGVGAYQIRFESLTDGGGITKTPQDVLDLGFELSWKRFEGTI